MFVMFRSRLSLLALAACNSDETSTANDGDASTDGATAADASADTGPIIPASDGGCDGSVPGMSAGSESQCAGKQEKPAPNGTGADPGASCAAAEDCKPFCCTCTGGDAGASFVSSVSVCGCGNVCASAQETCAFYEKTFQLCQ
jgi:hypothetical protein